MNWRWFHLLASPKSFYQICGKLLPWFWTISLLLFAAGLYQGLYNSVNDYQQGSTVRIMYIHVPAAIGSMMFYMGMAIAAAVGYIWRIKLAHMAAISIAPVGAALTLLALVTGSLWGSPMWGTWWVWDARLTSELILLFIYLGFISLHGAFEDREVGDRAAGVLAMVGVINVPIIHYSVQWWNTLHQGATISSSSTKMDPSMYNAFMLMFFAVIIFSSALVMYRMRNEVLSREHSKKWIKEELGL